MQPVIVAISKVNAELRDKITDDFPNAIRCSIVVILGRLVTPQTRAPAASAVGFLATCDARDTSAPRVLEKSDAKCMKSIATPFATTR
jgi:hypothetical protein